MNKNSANNLGFLLRPEARPPRLMTSPKANTRSNKNSQSENMSRHVQSRQASQQQLEESRPSLMSDQMIDEDDAGSVTMSRQLMANQTYSKPQLPRLNSLHQSSSKPAKDGRIMPMIQSPAGPLCRRGIKIPKPMNFPHSTKNATKNDANGGGKFIFGTAGGQFGVNGGQGTPSSRGAIMHAHTNITSRENYVDNNSNLDNHENASLRIGPGYTGRTFQSNLITSPTGGGSQRQPINAVLGQNMDDDEPEPDEQIVRTSQVNKNRQAVAAPQNDTQLYKATEIEEIRSVSTLYGNVGQQPAPAMSGFKKTSNTDQREKTKVNYQKSSGVIQAGYQQHPIQPMMLVAEKMEESENSQEVVPVQVCNDSKSGVNYSAANSNSFANFFTNQKKQKQEQNSNNADESRSQLAPGEKPWFYFGGDTSSSQNNNYQPSQKHEGVSPADRKIQNNATVNAASNSNKQMSQSVEDREGVVDLYSTSNVNTPNRLSTGKGALQLSDENAHVESNTLPSNLQKGRMTLRSVHLSSTEQMKGGDTKDADIAMVIHQEGDSDQQEQNYQAAVARAQQWHQNNRIADQSSFSASHKKEYQGMNDQGSIEAPPLEQELDASPQVHGQKKANKLLAQKSNSEQFGKGNVIPVLKLGDGEESNELDDVRDMDIKLGLNSGRQPRRVSSSHKDNLFITTEKKRYAAEAQQKQLLHLMPLLTDGDFEPSPTEPYGQNKHVLNPSLDYKIRSNIEAATGTAKQQNILTPSFISSEMQVAKLRRSDLLLKKKEPSVQARNSVDGATLAGEVAAEIAVSNNLNNSIVCCSQVDDNEMPRESRFSAGLTNHQAAIVSQALRKSLGKGRPVILGAGSPAVAQPNLRDSDSSLMLAASSRYSQQLQSTYQSAKNRGTIGTSQEMGRRSRTFKRRLPTGGNSAIRQSSSFSRRSIRKSTLSDAQEVTGFACYVKNFFSNLFGCCGSGGAQPSDPSAHRQSLNSSMQMPDYTFVAVPNGTNSVSIESSQTKQNAANGSNLVRRSQLIKDFKASQQQSRNQAKQSILDTEKDEVEIDIEGKDVAIATAAATAAAAGPRAIGIRQSLINEDAESDIIDDDNDHIASAQRPIQAARIDYLTPGDRIETSNNRVDTTANNNQQATSSRRDSSQQRLTAGTVEIATQITSDSQVDEFVFQKAAPQQPQGNANPFQVRPLSQYLADGGDELSDEDGDENYKTMSSASPSKGLPKFHNTDQPVALIADRHHHHHSNYEVPRNLSQLPIIEMAEDESKWDENNDNSMTNNNNGAPMTDDGVNLPPGAITQNNESSQPAQKKKKSLKDMITQVPQSAGQKMVTRPAHPQNQAKTGGKSQDVEYGRPSNLSENQRSSHSGSHAKEEEEHQSDYNDNEYGDEYEDGEDTPDVQKIHFNQTVQALFNIRATGLTMPPFQQIEHLLVDLPKFNHPSKTKTVVFDLDETLIHCVDDVETENPDVIIPIQFSEEPEPVLAGINIRPFARECLEAANEHFQVVIFTASEQEYADPIIDYLDPDGTLIQARYFRPSCVRTRNPDFYIKDMRIFHQRSLSDIILVDNSVYSFAFQLDNGVPIVSFYHDPKDEEMLHLKFYLDCLKDCDDVREKNKEAFQLVQLAETQLQRIIEEQQRYQHQTEDDYSPYQQHEGSYRLPEQAQHHEQEVMEEAEEDEEDGLDRDPTHSSSDLMNNRYHGSQKYITRDQQHSNIMEEDYEEEEEESFDCRL